jgi:hypothetical protein
MNKKIFSVILGIAVLIFSVLVFKNVGLNTDNAKYNLNADNSKKVIGSKSLQQTMTIIPYESIDQIIKDADLVCIGRVISEGKTLLDEAQYPKELTDKLASKGKHPPRYNVCQSKIEIEETLLGETDSKIITLEQLGAAGNNSGETKVKLKDKMLFILQQHDDDKNVYSSVALEEGMFKLQDNNKSLSLTDNPVMTKYDDIDSKILIRDIKKSIEKIKK